MKNYDNSNPILEGSSENFHFLSIHTFLLYCCVFLNHLKNILSLSNNKKYF
jgi:hypothetical protein